MFEISTIGADIRDAAITMETAFNAARDLNAWTQRVVQVVNTANGRHVYIADGFVSVYQKDGREDYSKFR